MSRRKIVDSVDPFWGNGEIALPVPEGIAASWVFLKGRTGNTHPGAALPMGMVTACAWSGGYPTGYYNQGPNCGGQVPRFISGVEAAGFTHIHVSGTGMIGHYYNYLRVIPGCTLGELDRLHPLANEIASPGYYRAEMADNKILAELTVTPCVAIHRYTFPSGVSPTVVVDATAGGLAFEEMIVRPTIAEIRIVEKDVAEIRIRVDELDIFAVLQADAPGATIAIWAGDEMLSDEEFKLSDGRRCGLFINGAASTMLRLAFSLKNFEMARRHLDATTGHSFDDIRVIASESWESQLGKICIDGVSKERRSIFYSALYHSLIKPMDCCGENPFDQQEEFYTDFATMWDMYKTQLPLLLTFYPNLGAKIVNSLLNTAGRLGYFPNMSLLIGDNDLREDQQGRALAFFTILDAWHRKIPGIDWQRALNLMVDALRRPANNDFFESGITCLPTHTLDLSGACDCVAQLARNLGDKQLAREMAGHSKKWVNAYDASTGILRNGTYYEGTAWHYSFRLLHDMTSRVSLYPEENSFVADLDRFFGYDAEPVKNYFDCEQGAAALAMNRFQGYNNEPDMETPYAYLYAGRHDRAAEVLRAGMRYMFASGRGGSPGNVDSGAISSCYVWNAIGIFPVAGQALFLIGSPIIPETRLRLAGADFVIHAPECDDWENAYIQRAWLNSKPIDRAWLTVDELLLGGELRIEMGPTPNYNWGRSCRPPTSCTETM